MRITVLDGHALNPGDLSWSPISSLGDFLVFDRTPPQLVANLIGNSEIILLNKIKIDESVLSICPNLRYIGVLATGYNVVDTKACRAHGVTVTNIPSYSTDAVAQHVFAFILNWTNRVSIHCEDVKNGGWIKNPDFCYWKEPLYELSGKTLGIFGFGNIGQKVAKIAKAFGMNVIAKVHNEKSFLGEEIESVSLEELFSRSDFLSLNAPLTDETEKIVNEKTISLMKHGAYIVNTARGGLVDENAIRFALDSSKIAGYATDVLVHEPMDADNPLLRAKNCVITPHIAWAAKETRARLIEIAAGNIRAFLDGKARNVVN